METYQGNFTNWQDVANGFDQDRYNATSEELAASLKAIPEPEKVYLAVYNTGNYEGSAWVVYRNNGKYYENSGGHCSCNGLEGQWSPEEYDNKELFIAVLEKRQAASYKYGFDKTHLDEIIKILKEE